MNHHAFDAVARRAARALDRRSLLGLVTGAILAGALRPLRTIAGNDPHQGGGGNGGGGNGGNNGKDKKDKKDKKCRKQASACISAVAAYCNVHYHDPDLNVLCKFAHQGCCGLYAKCKEQKAEQCLREVPY